MKAGAETRQACWLTMSLMAVFVAVYVAERALAIRTGRPDVLMAAGGVSRRLVLAGEPYRLLTAPFLHASLGHLLSNGVAFLLVGLALERMLGPATVFCVFALGGLAETIASITLNAPGVVSVGASGGIMALLMTLLVASLQMPEGRERNRVQLRAIWIMLLATKSAFQPGTLHVDFAAHFGGLLLGGAYGLVLVAQERSWRDTARFEEAERAVAAIAACAAALGFCAVLWRVPTLAQATAMLMPASELPHGTAQIEAQAPALVARYPNDPRAHLFAARERLARGDRAGAEREMRAALALAQNADGVFRPAFTNTIRGALASTLAEDGRLDEARALAGVACAAQGDASPSPELVARLQRDGACAGGDALSMR